MRPLEDIYRIAEDQHITVDYFRLSKREALSLMDDNGQCYIAIDPHRISSKLDERNKLAHEVGHCVTGSFYNQYAAIDSRQRHENRADKWAILQLIPVDELVEAIAEGNAEFWELAERFGVSEQFVKKAVCLYTHGNVAEDLYF